MLSCRGLKTAAYVSRACRARSSDRAKFSNQQSTISIFRFLHHPLIHFIKNVRKLRASSPQPFTGIGTRPGEHPPGPHCVKDGRLAFDRKETRHRERWKKQK